MTASKKLAYTKCCVRLDFEKLHHSRGLHLQGKIVHCTRFRDTFTAALVDCFYIIIIIAGMILTTRCFPVNTMTLHRCLVIVRLL